MQVRTTGGSSPPCEAARPSPGPVPNGGWEAPAGPAPFPSQPWGGCPGRRPGGRGQSPPAPSQGTRWGPRWRQGVREGLLPWHGGGIGRHPPEPHGPRPGPSARPHAGRGRQPSPRTARLRLFISSPGEATAGIDFLIRTRYLPSCSKARKSGGNGGGGRTPMQPPCTQSAATSVTFIVAAGHARRGVRPARRAPPPLARVPVIQSGFQGTGSASHGDCSFLSARSHTAGGLGPRADCLHARRRVVGGACRPGPPAGALGGGGRRSCVRGAGVPGGWGPRRDLRRSHCGPRDSGPAPRAWGPQREGTPSPQVPLCRGGFTSHTTLLGSGGGDACGFVFVMEEPPF